MSIFSALKHYLFYVIDKRSDPPEVLPFESRGQAVTAGYAKSKSCRHGKGRYDNCYVIPKAKGKAKHR